MTWLQSLLFGLISGIAEFLPISAEAHRGILRYIMNLPAEDALLRIVLHGASLAALLWVSRRSLRRLLIERKLIKESARSRRYFPPSIHRYTLRLYRTALVSIAVGLLVLARKRGLENQMNLLALVLLCNGLILFLSSLFPHGNRDGRTMSLLDGFLMGLGCGLGFLPGISRVGASLSLGSMQGVDKSYALRLGQLLWIPCLGLLLILDVFALVGTGMTALSVSSLAIYVLCAAAAYVGSYFSLKFMSFLSVNAGFSGFCYYNWGLALFAFILYLAV